MAGIADAWANAMQSATTQQKYRDKINAVQNSPMEAAAAAVDNGSYLQGIQNAIASGKMQRKLRACTLSNWKQVSSTAGAQNFATGAMKGKPKMQAAEATILAAGQAAKAAAQQANGPLAKVAAAINAVRQKWGYSAMV